MPDTLPERPARADIHPDVRIGHVHLKVADLDRALAFWRDVIGLEEQQRYGDQAVFLSAGGYHHHVALNTWESKGGAWPPPGTTGLFHVALLYPDRPALAVALKRLLDAGWPLEGASDHGVSEALYGLAARRVGPARDGDAAARPRRAAGGGRLNFLACAISYI